MWEALLQLLSGSSVPWIIGVLSTLITGWWALKKLRYEKRLEKFKETNANLFKEKKQEVLAAIATLSIFKKDPEFEKNTIDVLLSRLYTELDYDVINSILSTLIQNSNLNDLVYIANGLQDINRNFFIQYYPLNQRMIDINEASKKLNDSVRAFGTNEFDALLSEKKTEPEIFIKNKDLVTKKYDEEFCELFSYQKYKAIWHKQVTADAYAMFMRKAFLANKKDGLIMDLYQNDFNYVYMAELSFAKVQVSRSAISYSTIADVEFNKVAFFRTTLEGSALHTVHFKNGVMRSTNFSRVKFENVIFENIDFENCLFNTADFYSTTFTNCNGLTQEQFKDALRYDHNCTFPGSIFVEHNDEYLKRIEQAKTPNKPIET